MGVDGVRVLTIRQPWAWAIICGGKDVENRSWPTKHRGPLLIHAGSRFESDGYEFVKQLAAGPVPPAREFVAGAIIGLVDLVDCREVSDSRWAVDGQWQWCLRNPQPIEPPIPCAGKLGLWKPRPTSPGDPNTTDDRWELPGEADDVLCSRRVCVWRYWRDVAARLALVRTLRLRDDGVRH
jgi:hypothetical protein